MNTIVSPYTGIKQQTTLRFLSHVAFAKGVPLAVSAAFARRCLMYWGKDIQYVVTGPPGAGKSVILNLLGVCLNVQQPILVGIACSSAIENLFDSGCLPAETVADLKEIKESGDLIPTQYVQQALDVELNKLTPKPRVLIIDGGFRAPNQIPLMYDFAKSHGCNLGVTALMASDAICEYRMLHRPDAALRLDTKNAHKRITTFKQKTAPALKLARGDLGPNYLSVDTSTRKPVSTCKRVLQHLCFVAAQPYNPMVLDALRQKCVA